MIYSYVIDDARWIAFQSAVDARENRYDSLTSTAKKKENTALNEFPPQKNGTKKMPVFKAATAYTISALKSKAKTQTSAKS